MKKIIILISFLLTIGCLTVFSSENMPIAPVPQNRLPENEIIYLNDNYAKEATVYGSSILFYKYNSSDWQSVKKIYAKIIFDNKSEVIGDKFGYLSGDDARIGRITLGKETGSAQMIVEVDFFNDTSKTFVVNLNVVNSKDENFDIKINYIRITRMQEINRYYCLMLIENGWLGDEELLKKVTVTDAKNNNCMENNSFSIGQTSLAFYLDISKADLSNEFTLLLPKNLVNIDGRNSNALEYSFKLKNLEMLPDNFIDSIYPNDGDKYYLSMPAEELNVKIKLKKGFKLADKSKLYTKLYDDITETAEDGQTTLILPILVNDGGVYSIAADPGFITSNDGGLISGKVNYKFSAMLKDNIGLPNEAVFTDVHNEHWAFQYVSDLATKGIINGYPDGTFKPQNNVTRAELAKSICLAFNINTETSNSDYSDIENHWAKKYITALDSIIHTDNDMFHPDDLATREVTAAAFAEIMHLQSSDSQTVNFSDADSFNESLLSPVKAAYSNKLIVGYEDGTFKPKSNITRAEIAIMIYRAINAEQMK